MLNRLIFLITCCFFSSQFSAQTLSLQNNWWQPDDEVKSIVQDSSHNRLYLAGKFTYIGPVEKNGSMVNAITGEVSFEFPNPDGMVYASISDGNGGWYIGGAFTKVGDSLRDNLAHINQFGQVTSWRPLVNGTVIALTYSDSILYIGGSFSAVNNQSRNDLAAFNKFTGQLTNWNPSTNGEIYAIEFGDSTVYAGGNFSLINGQSRLNFVEITISGVPTLLNTTVNSLVKDIIYTDTSIYLGGYFTTINGVPRSRVAAINPITGLNQALDLGTIDGPVNTISLSNNTLFIGGDFDYVDGNYRDNVASFDLLAETLNNWLPAVGSAVNALSYHNGAVFIGTEVGSFNQAVDVLSKFDGITGEKISTWTTDAGGTIMTIGIENNSMYIGGAFYSIGGRVRNRLASIDMLTGQVTDWNPDVDDEVFELALLDTTLYVAGYFSTIGQSIRSSIAAISTNSGLVTSWNPNPQIPVEVTAIIPTETTVYVGGYFATTIGGQNRNNFVALDADLGIATSLISYPISSISVRDMILIDTSIYVSGSYPSSGQPAMFAISTNTGNNTNWNPMLGGGIVSQMKFDGNMIYITGYFGSVGGQTRTGLAALSPVTGLATSWNPNIWPSNPLGTQLGAFTLNDSHLFVKTSSGITAIDKTTAQFTNFVLPGTPFESSNDKLFIGGYYYFTLNQPVRNFSVLGICFPQDIYLTESACNEYYWSANGQTYTSSGIYVESLQSIGGCDSVVTLDLTINTSNTGIAAFTACDSLVWIDGITYYNSTTSPTWVLTNTAGCDSIVTLNLTITPGLPLSVNTFSQPSDVNSCLGNLSISTTGNTDFMESIDGDPPFNHNGYILVENLCPGVHSLFTTSSCGDTLTSIFVIPVDSNYVFNNPFIDSIAVDSLGSTIENCEIYYNSIDTAFIDSIFANGNTVTVIWNIVDSNGSNFDTSSYVLNNGNGVYWLQLSVFCPTRAVGDYFTVTEAIYFEDGAISTADLAYLDDDLFELFPNPTNDAVNIRFEAPDAELTIFDTQGKRIQAQKIQSGESISLSHVDTGVYLFEFTTTTGITMKRVVKQ